MSDHATIAERKGQGSGVIQLLCEDRTLVEEQASAEIVTFQAHCMREVGEQFGRAWLIVALTREVERSLEERPCAFVVVLFGCEPGSASQQPDKSSCLARR